MTRKGQRELEEIKRELRSIIRELEDIASGINKDLKGIGNERCAAVIYDVVSQYKYVLKQLNGVNTSKVTEEYAAVHGGGGKNF